MITLWYTNHLPSDIFDKEYYFKIIGLQNYDPI